MVTKNVSKGFCRIAEAAHYLDVSDRTIRRLIDTGALPSKKVGECVLIPRAALDDLPDGASTTRAVPGIYCRSGQGVA